MHCNIANYSILCQSHEYSSVCPLRNFIGKGIFSHIFLDYIRGFSELAELFISIITKAVFGVKFKVARPA